ncbi:MAG: hypothetical protein OXH75_16675 [Acidobacteria bacterium]|nr:hypothetical protein [Acidobacteriota bacterium]
MAGRRLGRGHRRAAMLSAALLLHAGTALAQPPSEPRLILGTTVGAQFVRDAFSQHIPLRLHGEQGEFAATYDVAAGLAHDFSAAVRAWGPLALGVELANFRKTTSTAIEADVPHPVFLGFARRLTASVDDVVRREQALHLQGQYWRELWGTLFVRFFGGPTLFRLRHDLVSGIEAAEGPTFDDVTLAGHHTIRQSRADFGYNVGLDVSYFGLQRLGLFGRHEILERMALAFVVRYSQGTSAIQVSGGIVQPEYELGGTHIGGGLRVAF